MNYKQTKETETQKVFKLNTNSKNFIRGWTQTFSLIDANFKLILNFKNFDSADLEKNTFENHHWRGNPKIFWLCNQERQKSRNNAVGRKDTKNYENYNPSVQIWHKLESKSLGTAKTAGQKQWEGPIARKIIRV